jgi:hypothetical protein
MGLIGLVLPVVVVLSGFALYGSAQDSLSDYYGLGNRNVYIIMMLIVAWFLVKYKGDDFIDNIAGKLAGIFAFGVVFLSNNAGGWQAVLHFLSATGLFLMFSFFCLFLFTKTAKSQPNDLWHTLASFRFGIIKSNEPDMRLKKKRNRVYISCGLFILSGMVITVVYNLFWQNTGISSVKPVLLLEWLMIWAFAFSWLVKGGIIWSDNKIPVISTPPDSN